MDKKLDVLIAIIVFLIIVVIDIVIGYFLSQGV